MSTDPAPGEVPPADGMPRAEAAEPPAPVSRPGDLARDALARARATVGPPARRRTASTASRRSAGRSPGDPVPLGAAVSELLAVRGWEQSATTARVFACWPEIVGADVAAHAAARSLTDGRLVVVAESSAWATQLRLLGPQLLERIRAVVGDGVVGSLVVQGPSGPDWRHGPRRVRGGRGPRDTYG